MNICSRVFLCSFCLASISIGEEEKQQERSAADLWALSAYYRTGHTVPKDLAAAKQYFIEAMEKLNPKVAVKGKSLYNDDPIYRARFNHLWRLLIQADSSDPYAMYELGDQVRYLTMKQGDDQENEKVESYWEGKALPILKTWAENGDAKAQYYLSRTYLPEYDSLPDGKNMPLVWLFKSAMAGYLDAQLDLLTELWLLIQEAPKGNDMTVLKREYVKTQLYPADDEDPQHFLQFIDKERFRLAYEAATHGSPQGMEYVAECYESGIGVEKDRKKALLWFHYASHNGNTAVSDYLGELPEEEFTRHGLSPEWWKTDYILLPVPVKGNSAE